MGKANAHHPLTLVSSGQFCLRGCFLQVPTPLSLRSYSNFTSSAPSSILSVLWEAVSQQHLREPSFQLLSRVASVLSPGESPHNASTSSVGSLPKLFTSLCLEGEAATRRCKEAPGSCLGKGLAVYLRAWSFLKFIPASPHAPGCPNSHDYLDWV